MVFMGDLIDGMRVDALYIFFENHLKVAFFIYFVPIFLFLVHENVSFGTLSLNLLCQVGVKIFLFNNVFIVEKIVRIDKTL